jgi:ferredoxin
MVIVNNTILYFSGTGNSLHVAKGIANSGKGFDLIKIANLRNEEKIVVKAKILGIVFPVYYARLPKIVEKTLKRFEFNSEVYVFAVATHGGAPATVLEKLETMLQDNGCHLNAGFLVHMPKNFVLKYNTRPYVIGDKIFDRGNKKIECISEIIRKRENINCEKSKLIVDTIVDKAFMSITDKIVDSMSTMDTQFWTNDDCNGCKLCVQVCPVDNIEFIAKPVWKHNCEVCMACIQHCSTQAIQWSDKTVNRKRYVNPNVSIDELI